MRLAFLLLLAANLAVAAWFLNFAPESASDPEPSRRQLEPEKIRVLEAKELKELGALPPPRQKPPALVAAASACVEWGGFALAEAPKAEQALAPLALGAKLSQRRSEETAGWWVYIPPQANRAAALKKTAELKALGIEEFFVMQEAGRSQWAISLGVFSSEDAARNRLETLRAQGVRSAQTGARDTQVSKVWFQVRGAEPPVLARLRELAQGLPGTELKDCPPP